MTADRAIVLSETGRRPRTVLIGIHLGVLVALVLGSGAIAGHEAAVARSEAAVKQAQMPRPLHRFSECCAGSTDPSMEVY